VGVPDPGCVERVAGGVEVRWDDSAWPPDAGESSPARSAWIETAWLRPAGVAPGVGPLWIFLHEGLGSVSMWRDFPARLCSALGVEGLLYSRPGYGRSTPRPPAERWQPDFMHRQAHAVLPALLRALGIDAARRPLWLFGHSDGGSIVLLHAASHPRSLAGVVVLAPHIFVEDVSITSIQAARLAYERTDLRQRLARHHDDPDSAFFGWNDIWLDPAFRGWSIAAEIDTIGCPLLAVQGLEDEYGTLAQIHGIAARVPHTRLLALPGCGHSPHRDQPDALIAAVQSFVAAAARAPGLQPG
jgi:pimeloyl-ACP methyl ester carboxylesterase